jgi:hypothetical protein
MSTNKKFRIQNGVDITGEVVVGNQLVITAEGKLVLPAIEGAISDAVSADIAALQAQVDAILGTSPEHLDTLQEIVALFQSEDGDISTLITNNSTAITQIQQTLASGVATAAQGAKADTAAQQADLDALIVAIANDASGGSSKKFISSGTISSGESVLLNSSGTVSSCGLSATGVVGEEVTSQLMPPYGYNPTLSSYIDMNSGYINTPFTKQVMATCPVTSRTVFFFSQQRNNGSDYRVQSGFVNDDGNGFDFGTPVTIQSSADGRAATNTSVCFSGEGDGMFLIVYSSALKYNDVGSAGLKATLCHVDENGLIAVHNSFQIVSGRPHSNYGSMNWAANTMDSAYENSVVWDTSQGKFVVAFGADSNNHYTNTWGQPTKIGIWAGGYSGTSLSEDAVNYSSNGIGSFGGSNVNFTLVYNTDRLKPVLIGTAENKTSWAAGVHASFISDVDNNVIQTPVELSSSPYSSGALSMVGSRATYNSISGTIDTISGSDYSVSNRAAATMLGMYSIGFDGTTATPTFIPLDITTSKEPNDRVYVQWQDIQFQKDTGQTVLVYQSDNTSSTSVMFRSNHKSVYFASLDASDYSLTSNIESYDGSTWPTTWANGNPIYRPEHKLAHVSWVPSVNKFILIRMTYLQIMSQYNLANNIKYQMGINLTQHVPISTADQAIGFAQDTVGSGEQVTIVLGGGVSEAHTGLTVGSEYFIQGDGTVSTTESPILAGLALSATELQVADLSDLDNVSLSPYATTSTLTSTYATKAYADLVASQAATGVDLSGYSTTVEMDSAIAVETAARTAAIAAIPATDLTPYSTTVEMDSAIATAKTEAQTYADQVVAATVDAAPAALDTLNELAAALGDDANFASTVTASIATKADDAATTAALATKADDAATTAALDSKADGSVVSGIVDYLNGVEVLPQAPSKFSLLDDPQPQYALNNAADGNYSGFGETIKTYTDYILVSHDDKTSGLNQSGSIFIYDRNDMENPVELYDREFTWNRTWGNTFYYSEASKILMVANDIAGSDSHGSLQFYDLTDLSNITKVYQHAFPTGQGGNYRLGAGSGYDEVANKFYATRYGDTGNSPETKVGQLFVYDATNITATPVEITPSNLGLSSNGPRNWSRETMYWGYSMSAGGGYVYVNDLFNQDYTIIDTSDNSLVGTFAINYSEFGVVIDDYFAVYNNSDTFTFYNKGTSDIAFSITPPDSGSGRRYTSIYSVGNYYAISRREGGLHWYDKSDTSTVAFTNVWGNYNAQSTHLSYDSITNQLYVKDYFADVDNRKNPTYVRQYDVSELGSAFNAIETAIANIPGVDLSDYSTTAQMDSAIAAIPSTDLTPYSTTVEMNSAIAAIPSTDLTPYSTTVEMGSAIATAKSEAQSYADQVVAATVDAAPAALDTLNELAAALGDDANFASTVTASIATKADDAATTAALASKVGIAEVDVRMEPIKQLAESAIQPSDLGAGISSNSTTTQTWDVTTSQSVPSAPQGGELETVLTNGTGIFATYKGGSSTGALGYGVYWKDLSVNQDYFIADISGSTDSAKLGASSGLSDDYFVLAGQGKVAVWSTSDGSLVVEKARGLFSGSSREFGKTVTLNGNKVIIGDYLADNEAGAVYVFDIISEQITKISNPDTATYKRFSHSKAYSDKADGISSYGNKVLVGAPYVSSDVWSPNGKVFVFDINDGSLIHTLSNPNGSDTITFGLCSTANDNYYVVGSSQTKGSVGQYPTSSSGAIFIYSATDGSYISTIKNPGRGVGSSDNNSYGRSVKLSDGVLFVAAERGDTGEGTDGSSDSKDGKIYLYEMSNNPTLIDTIDSLSPSDWPLTPKLMDVSGTILVVGDYFDNSSINYWSAIEVTSRAVISIDTSTIATKDYVDSGVAGVDLSAYSTTAEMDSAIAAIPATDLTPYSTTAQMDSAIAVETAARTAAIAAIPATDLTPYSTTTEMGSAIATAKSEAQSYADQVVASTIDAAPASLDTLNELAAALGDDANFASTVTASIATKADDAATTAALASKVGIAEVDVRMEPIKQLAESAIQPEDFGAGIVQGVGVSDWSASQMGSEINVGTSYAVGMESEAIATSDLYYVTVTNTNSNSNGNINLLVWDKSVASPASDGWHKDLSSSLPNDVYSVTHLEMTDEYVFVGFKSNNSKNILAIKISDGTVYRDVKSIVDAAGQGGWSAGNNGHGHKFDIDDKYIAIVDRSESNVVIVVDYTTGQWVRNYTFTGARDFLEVAVDSGKMLVSGYRSNDQKRRTETAELIDIASGSVLHTLTRQHAQVTDPNWNGIGWGGTVLLSGDYAVVGSMYGTTNSSYISGKLDVFDVSTGSHIVTLSEDYNTVHNRFAYGLDRGATDLYGSYLVATTSDDKAYVYDLSTSSSDALTVLTLPYKMGARVVVSSTGAVFNEASEKTPNGSNASVVNVIVPSSTPLVVDTSVIATKEYVDSGVAGVDLTPYSTTTEMDSAIAVETAARTAAIAVETAARTAAIAAIPATDLTPYSTTVEMDSAIAVETAARTAAISAIPATDLSAYSTTAEMDSAIAAIPATDLTPYSTTVEMDSAIAAIPATDLTPYSTTAQMDSAIAVETAARETAVTSAISTAAADATAKANAAQAAAEATAAADATAKADAAQAAAIAAAGTAATQAIAATVDAAPASLDTLNELAAALGDDANFASTVTASIATKADADATAASIASKVGIAEVDIRMEPIKQTAESAIQPSDLGNGIAEVSSSVVDWSSLTSEDFAAISDTSGLYFVGRQVEAVDATDTHFVTLQFTPGSADDTSDSHRELIISVHLLDGTLVKSFQATEDYPELNYTWLSHLSINGNYISLSRHTAIHEDTESYGKIFDIRNIDQADHGLVKTINENNLRRLFTIDDTRAIAVYGTSYNSIDTVKVHNISDWSELYSYDPMGTPDEADFGGGYFVTGGTTGNTNQGVTILKTSGAYGLAGTVFSTTIHGPSNNTAMYANGIAVNDKYVVFRTQDTDGTNRAHVHNPADGSFIRSFVEESSTPWQVLNNIQALGKAALALSGDVLFIPLVDWNSSANSLKKGVAIYDILTGELLNELTMYDGPRYSGAGSSVENLYNAYTVGGSTIIDINEEMVDAGSTSPRIATALTTSVVSYGVDTSKFSTTEDINATIAAETAARTAAIAVETAARTATIAAETSARTAAIAVETAARTAAIAAIPATDLTPYATSSTLTSEVARATAAEAVNAANIVSETTARTSADAALESDIIGLQNQVGTIISGSPASLDTLVEIVSAFENADSDLSGVITANGGRLTAAENNITALDTDITAEENARGAGDTALGLRLDSDKTALDTAIATETSGRIAGDSDLSAAISAEETDRIAGDASLQSAIDALTGSSNDAISSETTARTTAVATETADRIAGDSDLQSAIDAEISRATSAESGLQSQISNVLSNTDATALNSLAEIVAEFQNADSTLTGAVSDHGTRLTDLEGRTTDNIPEGISNKYYSDDRVKTALSGGLCINDTKLQATGEIAVDEVEAEQSLRVAEAVVSDNTTKLEGQGGSHYRIDIYDVNGVIIND